MTTESTITGRVAEMHASMAAQPPNEVMRAFAREQAALAAAGIPGRGCRPRNPDPRCRPARRARVTDDAARRDGRPPSGTGVLPGSLAPVLQHRPVRLPAAPAPAADRPRRRARRDQPAGPGRVAVHEGEARPVLYRGVRSGQRDRPRPGHPDPAVGRGTGRPAAARTRPDRRQRRRDRRAADADRGHRRRRPSRGGSTCTPTTAPAPSRRRSSAPSTGSASDQPGGGWAPRVMPELHLATVTAADGRDLLAPPRWTGCGRYGTAPAGMPPTSSDTGRDLGLDRQDHRHRRARRGPGQGNSAAGRRAGVLVFGPPGLHPGRPDRHARRLSRLDVLQPRRAAGRLVARAAGRGTGHPPVGCPARRRARRRRARPGRWKPRSPQPASRGS